MSFDYLGPTGLFDELKRPRACQRHHRVPPWASEDHLLLVGKRAVFTWHILAVGTYGNLMAGLVNPASTIFECSCLHEYAINCRLRFRESDCSCALEPILFFLSVAVGAPSPNTIWIGVYRADVPC